MRIAVDGFELRKRFTGVGRFLANLLDALLERDRDNHYTLFLKESSPRVPTRSNLESRVLEGADTHTRWQNGALHRALKRGGFDLFLSPDHSVPLLYWGRSFMTIHDVSWKTQPADYSLKERTVRDLKTRIGVRRAQWVFTDSVFSRDEILRHYPGAADKITVVPLAVEADFKPASEEDLAAFRTRYGLGKTPLIGFLGSMFRRRRIRELLEAFAQIAAQTDATLLLVGRDFHEGALDDALCGRRVRWLERIQEDEINAFYSSLDLFVYPSDHEGFGFPPLEALACGTIPVVSATSSLREIFQGLAVFMDSHRPGQMAAVLLDSLKRRNDISRRLLATFGHRRKYFSWNRVAGDYLRRYPPGSDRTGRHRHE